MEIGRGGGKITPSESAFLPRGSEKCASTLCSRFAAEAKVEEPETPGQKTKEGVNNILNKGKNLLKKK